MKNKKRVILTTLGYYPEYGGVENSIKFLAREFRRMGYIPVVVAAQSQKRLFKRVELIQGIPVIRFPFRPYNSKFLNLLSFPNSIITLYLIMRKLNLKGDIESQINRNQFTSFVANCVFDNTTYIAPGFSKFQSSPDMLSRTMSFSKRVVTKLKAIIHNWFDYRALVSSDKVFLFSENMREQAINVLGNDNRQAEQFKVTKPGVDTVIFNKVSAQQKAEFRVLLGLPSDKIVALSVGRFVSAKGFWLLAEASRLKSSSFVTVIVGDGPDRADIIREYRKEIQEGKLILPGKTDLTDRYYKASDIFVLSSIYEPLGQTLLEAGACGLPVVGFRSNGEDVVTATEEIYGELARYSTDVDGGGLAELVEEYATLTSQERERLSSRYRELVLERYSWTTLAKQLTSSE